MPFLSLSKINEDLNQPYTDVLTDQGLNWFFCEQIYEDSGQLDTESSTDQGFYLSIPYQPYFEALTDEDLIDQEFNCPIILNVINQI